jgi:hypothetical protein
MPHALHSDQDDSVAQLGTLHTVRWVSIMLPLVGCLLSVIACSLGRLSLSDGGRLCAARRTQCRKGLEGCCSIPATINIYFCYSTCAAAVAASASSQAAHLHNSHDLCSPCQGRSWCTCGPVSFWAPVWAYLGVTTNSSASAPAPRPESPPGAPILLNSSLLAPGALSDLLLEFLHNASL